ncbi:OsmC family protein [Paraburkholderia oxyphila]|uniref:OsmC family protein n=1 Tax=Paraburkholderia oxyphila TaxID=614212 RepID=UPI0004824306|nr:OsmC family protein [Paraburkholderia oxyphila]
MVVAKRTGAVYGVEIANGRVRLMADTRKAQRGGDTGMRPHELLESALAACICMSIEMAAECAGVAMRACTVEVRLDRRDHETRFDVAAQFGAALSGVQADLVRTAMAASPVASTLGRPVRFNFELGAH